MRGSALALALLAPASGCGACRDTEERGPVVVAPIRAEFVVRKEAWTKAVRSSRAVDGVLVIASAVPVEHEADCWGPERALLGDSTGTRFAYRCAETERWRLVFVGKNGHAWETCRTDGGAGAAVDWSTTPELEGAAAELAACAGKRAKPLFADLMARRPALAADVLVATASESFGADEERGDDAWLVAERALPKEEGARVHEALRAMALRPDAEGPALFRALVLVGPKAIGDDALFARFLEVLARPLSTVELGLFLSIASRALASSRAQAIGTPLCALLTGTAARTEAGWRRDLTAQHLTTALAASGLVCPSLASALGCKGGYACSEEGGRPHLCTAEELRGLLDQERAKDPVAVVRGETPTWTLQQAELAVAYAASAVTADFSRRNERRLYAQEPPEPECWRVETLGGPCRCFGNQEAMDALVCGLDPAAAKARAEDCDVVIDDEAKVLRATKRCKMEGHCNRDVDCCNGRCEEWSCRRPVASSSSPGVAPPASAPPASSSAR